MTADLAIDVDLPGPWARLAEPALQAEAQAAVGAAIGLVLGDFGVPANVLVTLHPVAQVSGEERPRLRCNGERFRCGALLAARICAHLDRAPLQARHFEPLPAGAEQAFDDAGVTARWIRHLALVCAEVLKQHPQRLLGAAQAAALAERLRAKSIPIATADEAGFAEVLGRLLEQRIGLAAIDTIGEHWRDGRANHLAPSQIAESLIDALSAEAIVIRAALPTLRELTQNSGPPSVARASVLRDEAYFALGVAYPDFRFALDDALPAGAFSFEIQALRTLPAFGLEGATRLETEAALVAIGEALVLHPATLKPHRRVAAGESPADGVGIDAIAYLLAVLGQELRAVARCFVRQADVSEALGRDTPEDRVLARAVRARHTDACVTEVLRLLVDERISIRNLRRIAENLCSFEPVVVDAASLIVFDPRLPVATEPDAAWLADPRTLVEFARSGLKAQIGRQLGASDSIAVFLFDPEIERALAAVARPPTGGGPAGRLSEADERALLQGLRERLGTRAAGEPGPVLLTTLEARAMLREHTRDEYPTANVVSYSELPMEASLQPIARIAFARAD